MNTQSNRIFEMALHELRQIYHTQSEADFREAAEELLTTLDEKTIKLKAA